MKRALITGVNGQDGSYLAEFLLEKNYEVHGIIRRSSTDNLSNLKDILENKNLHLHFGDLSDFGSINKIIREIEPDEIYNLAAQSYVGSSFDTPEYTGDINGLGVLRILESVRQNDLSNKTKFYQASTSELYGKVEGHAAQSEKTTFHPRSPYSVGKLFGYWTVKNYRESYGIFASNGILFNHESPRRGETFLTRKVTLAVANIKEGLQKSMDLGNLDSKRDWGYAKEYVEGMWAILQEDKPDDYVVGTGETHSVREFVEESFRVAGIEIESNGKIGIEEEYIRKDTGEVVVKINPKYYRPAEVDYLLSDFSKSNERFGWSPKVKFKELVMLMVEADLNSIKKSSSPDYHFKLNELVKEIVEKNIRKIGETPDVFRR